MQILVNGILNGLLLGVLAQAFTLVYLPTRVFFIAAAGIYALTPYLQMQFTRWGLPPSVALPLTLFCGIALSTLFEILNHRVLDRRRAASGAHLVSSLGLYLVLVQLIVLTWGTGAQILRTGVGEALHYGGVVVTHSQLTSGLISAALLASCWVWLHFSKLGLELRALAGNRDQLALFGYNTARLRLYAFGVSGLLTAVSSLLAAQDYGFDPHFGMPSFLLAVVAAILGGRHSFVGPILGGLLLGTLRALIAAGLSASWQDAGTFLLLALFLVFRPGGIASPRARLESA